MSSSYRQQEKQFYSSFPKIATDLDTHIAHLLETAQTEKPFLNKREATGGILPIVRDPDTRLTYFLLGLNHQHRYCHFHGWVDPGETQSQGAARECFEESKATLGDLTSLWRAVTCRNVFSALVGRGGMMLVNFGDLNAVQREEFVMKFAGAKGWDACSDEVAAVKWFDTLSFRHAALNREHEKADVFVEVDVARGIRRKLRGWLADIFSARDFWEQPVLKSSVDGGFIPLIPIQYLPKIQDKKILDSLPVRFVPPSAAAKAGAGGTSKAVQKERDIEKK